MQYSISIGLSKRELSCLSLVCSLLVVYHGLFALSFGVIGRLCSLIMVISGQLPYYYLSSFFLQQSHSIQNAKNVMNKIYKRASA